MKLRRLPVLATTIAAMSVMLASCTGIKSSDSDSNTDATPSATTLDTVSPKLRQVRDEIVEGQLWQRPGLSQRDRGLVTVSVLITNAATTEMAHYFAKALDSGLTPAELSETITHLAFYAGWPSAMAAVEPARALFGARGIDPGQLPKSAPNLLPLDEAAEARRAAQNDQNYGAVAPGVLQYTTDLVFRDLWLRPALAPKDRSLVTVTSLIASSQVAQIPFHLNRAMDNGLTADQASETLTQLSFYIGWPKVFTALPVVKDVLQHRKS